ncbi:MAG: IS1634 family transposase [Proteobacteria bacterium]|nr:IS1634 family transposase [Pseudomonadota bacterium]
MFLRKNRKSANGEVYEYWTLCETVRTELGPRQRVVATLGKLSEQDLAAGWEDIEALLEGRKPAPRQLLLEKTKVTPNPDACTQWELADLANLTVERVREFGNVYLALALWRRLGLHDLLSELMDCGRETVPWAEVAAVLTAGKFCGQASELGVAEEWYARTALEDLSGIAPELINDDRLYRGLDHLAKHKDRLCEHLMQRYRDWFGVRFEFLLYDVTSTYFEGQALGNTKAARGYSRDKRSDCKQVCIGLVCTPEGLPLNYEVFAGNRVDVTTVEDVVRKMEDRFGQAERIWVMDRGMVSEANIDFLRQRKALYIVGTPKADLRHFEAELAEEENWKVVQPGLEARVVAHPDGDGNEKYVLCRSQARGEKEKAMLERQMKRLTEELLKIDTALRESKRKATDLGKIERRIGRWQGRNPAAARLLDVVVLKDEKQRALGLRLSCPLEKGTKSDLAKGAYLLRTNCTETDPAKLWRWYMQLTQAEAAFRTAKSDIGLRPVYHRKTERVEAHLLVCFLSLALWRSLEMWMLGKGLGSNARKLVDAFETIKSMDVVVPVKRGDVEVKVRLRTVAKPEEDVAVLLSHLGLRLPSRSKTVQNVVEKNG